MSLINHSKFLVILMLNSYADYLLKTAKLLLLLTHLPSVNQFRPGELTCQQIMKVNHNCVRKEWHWKCVFKSHIVWTIKGICTNQKEQYFFIYQSWQKYSQLFLPSSLDNQKRNYEQQDNCFFKMEMLIKGKLREKWYICCWQRWLNYLKLQA